MTSESPLFRGKAKKIVEKNTLNAVGLNYLPFFFILIYGFGDVNVKLHNKSFFVGNLMCVWLSFMCRWRLPFTPFSQSEHEIVVFGREYL